MESNEASGKQQGFDQSLHGTWIVVKARREGVDAPDVVGHLLEISGNGFEIREGESTLFQGCVLIDKSGGDLWQIDITHTEGAAAGQTWLGVMRLHDNGVMEICDNAIDPCKPRPHSLESAPGSGTIHLDFKPVSQ